MEPSPSIGHTLLLVEDNEDNRIIYSTVLRHVGYAVVEAQDGREAISLARSVLPDLILMDISIPEVTAGRRRACCGPIRRRRTSRSSR